MSFKLNNSQQLTLHDSFINLPARSQKMLMKSWCRDFAEIVFPAINEERFAVLYSDRKFSRPNTPVNFIVGALILKSEHNLNDDELIESICFDVRYQYALHTTHLEEQPVSDRTFSRFRERLYEFSQETGRDLMAEEMESLNGAYATYMNLRGNVKRMDSLMVASRCKRMSRLEIVYATCANAVKLIHRMDCDALLPASFRHYLEEEDYNKTIYYCKPEEAGPRLEQALQEANTIKEAMAEDPWHEHMEYQLLIRVIREQAGPTFLRPIAATVCIKTVARQRSSGRITQYMYRRGWQPGQPICKRCPQMDTRNWQRCEMRLKAFRRYCAGNTI